MEFIQRGGYLGTDSFDAPFALRQSRRHSFIQRFHGALERLQLEREFRGQRPGDLIMDGPSLLLERIELLRKLEAQGLVPLDGLARAALL